MGFYQDLRDRMTRCRRMGNFMRFDGQQIGNGNARGVAIVSIKKE